MVIIIIIIIYYHTHTTKLLKRGESTPPPHPKISHSSFPSLTKEAHLFPPHHCHKYLSSEVDSSSLIHFHACTYLDWIPVKNNYNGPPRIWNPLSLPRGVCCQNCLDDFPESGCPHLCLISTTIRPSNPDLMRRHLQPGLEDPTDKEAIQPQHKYFPPDPLGRNRPLLQNTFFFSKTMKHVVILIQKTLLCAPTCMRM